MDLSQLPPELLMAIGAAIGDAPPRDMKLARLVCRDVSKGVNQGIRALRLSSTAALRSHRHRKFLRSLPSLRRVDFGGYPDDVREVATIARAFDFADEIKVVTFTNDWMLSWSYSSSLRQPLAKVHFDFCDALKDPRLQTIVDSLQLAFQRAREFELTFDTYWGHWAWWESEIADRITTIHFSDMLESFDIEILPLMGRLPRLRAVSYDGYFFYSRQTLAHDPPSLPPALEAISMRVTCRLVSLLRSAQRTIKWVMLDERTCWQLTALDSEADVLSAAAYVAVMPRQGLREDEIRIGHDDPRGERTSEAVMLPSQELMRKVGTVLHRHGIRRVALLDRLGSQPRIAAAVAETGLEVIPVDDGNSPEVAAT